MNIIIQKEIGSFFLSLPPISYFRYKNSVARSTAQNRAKNPFPVEAFALSANIKYEFVTDIAILLLVVLDWVRKYGWLLVSKSSRSS